MFLVTMLLLVLHREIFEIVLYSMYWSLIPLLACTVP